MKKRCKLPIAMVSIYIYIYILDILNRFFVYRHVNSIGR